MKTIYCPACGQLCEVTRCVGIDINCQCPAGHKWAMLVDVDADQIQGFQCDGTTVEQLPNPLNQPLR